MTKMELYNAIVAWECAVNDMILSLGDGEVSLGRQRALQYGKRITTPEHIDQVAKVFDFLELSKLITAAREKQ